MFCSPHLECSFPSPVNSYSLLTAQLKDHFLKNTIPVLTGVAQLLGCHPADRQFADLIRVRVHAWITGQVPG